MTSSSLLQEKELTLRSSDGKEFVVRESIAVQSSTLKNILDDDCASTTIPLPVVDGKTLAMVLEYCEKHVKDASKNVEKKDEDNDDDDDDEKKFDSEFVSKKEMKVLFDLVLASNYLDIKDLMDLVCQKIADEIKDMMMPEQVRDIFGIVNDFTPEEDAKVREEHAWAFE